MRKQAEGVGPPRFLERLGELPVLPAPGFPCQRPHDLLRHAAIARGVEGRLLDFGRQPSQVLAHQIDERLRGVRSEVEPGGARPLAHPADDLAARRRRYLHLIPLGENPEARGLPVGTRRDEQHRRALRRPSGGVAPSLGQGIPQAVGHLGPEIRHPAHEDQPAAREERQRRSGGDEDFRGQLVRVEDLAIQAGGLVVGQERPGQALDHVVDEEGLGAVEEEQRGDTSGRGVAEEGADLQLRILRRRS